MGDRLGDCAWESGADASADASADAGADAGADASAECEWESGAASEWESGAASEWESDWRSNGDSGELSDLDHEVYVETLTGVAAQERALASLAEAQPAPWTLAELTLVQPEDLDPDDAVTFLVALQRHSSWLASLEARALVRAAGAHTDIREVTMHDPRSHRERRITIVDEAREEIAAALHRSPMAVHDQLEQARALHGPLRRTRDALASGSLGVAQARSLVQQATRMSGADTTLRQSPDADSTAEAEERALFGVLCTRLQDRVLDRACRSVPSAVTSMARRAVAVIDAPGARERHRRMRRFIDVQLLPDDDGLAVLIARMAAADAARAYEAISTEAARSGDDALTIGQRRAAALLSLVSGRRASGSGATTGIETGIEIGVTIDLATLLGWQEGCATLRAPGFGDGEPVTLEAVRDLLDDPTVGVTLRRLVNDPLTGELLDRGRRAYVVPDSLRSFLAARDGTCRFPGCRRRASSCQIDHVIPWDAGGGTDRANLGALCVRHHQLKTHAGWQVRARGSTDAGDSTDAEGSTDAGDSGGSCTWRSPGGRTYDHDPPPF